MKDEGLDVFGHAICCLDCSGYKKAASEMKLRI